MDAQQDTASFLFQFSGIFQKQVLLHEIQIGARFIHQDAGGILDEASAQIDKLQLSAADLIDFFVKQLMNIKRSHDVIGFLIIAL